MQVARARAPGASHTRTRVKCIWAAAAAAVDDGAAGSAMTLGWAADSNRRGSGRS